MLRSILPRQLGLVILLAKLMLVYFVPIQDLNSLTSLLSNNNGQVIRVPLDLADTGQKQYLASKHLLCDLSCTELLVFASKTLENQQSGYMC